MNADSPETPKIEFNYGLFFAITSVWFILGSSSYALYLLSQHGQEIGNSHEVLDRVVVLLTICFFIFVLFFPESKVVTLASIPKFKVDSRNLIFLCALIGILGIPQILYSARDQWVGIGPIAAVGAMLLANAKWFYHQLLSQRIFKLCAAVFICVTYLPSHFQFFTDVSDRYHNLLLVNDDFSKLAISGYEGQYSAIYSSLGAEFAQLGNTLPPSDSYTQVELVFIVRVILSVIFTLLIVLSISKLLSKPSKWMAWLVVPFMHSNSFFSLQGSLNEQLNLTTNRLFGFSILLLIMVFIRNPLIQVAIAFRIPCDFLIHSK
jgi:hypothetical protein